jgi:hypothetical protein
MFGIVYYISIRGDRDRRRKLDDAILSSSAMTYKCWLLAVALFAAACSKPSGQWLTISEATDAYRIDPSTRSDLPAVTAVLAPRTHVRLLESRQGKEWLVYRILTPAGDTAFVTHRDGMNIVAEP